MRKKAYRKVWRSKNIAPLDALTIPEAIAWLQHLQKEAGDGAYIDLDDGSIYWQDAETDAERAARLSAARDAAKATRKLEKAKATAKAELDRAAAWNSYLRYGGQSPL